MLQLMSKITKKTIIVFGVLIIFSSFVFYKYVFDRNDVIFELLFEGLNQKHYSPLKIDDSFSEKAFDLYLNQIDAGKKFLLQSDVDALGKYRHDIDDEIMTQRHDFYRQSLEIINARVKEKEKWSEEILSKPLDYSVNDTYETDNKKVIYSTNEKDLKKEWEKMVKYQVLFRLDEMLLKQEKAIEKKDTSVKILSFDSLEVDARRKTLKANVQWFKRLNKISSRERFSQFANAITGVYDPHTEYFAPKERKRFGEMMSGQFEGIGARLQQKDDGALKVSEIIMGSPSYKQNELKAGDEIIKVAQGNKEPVDITVMDMEDAIELIKGKKGTEVRLTVRKSDATIKVIPIIRDVIEMEDILVKSAVIENKNKIGYIYLPSFYTPFGTSGGHNCSIDVRKELEKLKKRNVKSIILDVRDNGGGSLQEVVEMAGLFFPRGPVAQVKNKVAQSVLEDKNADVVWDGPLAIMINHNSASASEILAAAIQDYKRGVIIGNTSFGKGTVQTFIDLDLLLAPQFDTIKPTGQVKITQQKFYRINGGATQIKGVTPDIVLPDPYEFIEVGEKELENPLPWDEIGKAEYKEFDMINYAGLVKKSKARVSKSPQFALIQEQAKDVKARKDDTKFSLSLEGFRAEQKSFREQNKKYDDLHKEIKDFRAYILDEDKTRFGNDTAKVGRETRWAKNLGKDLYLYEASNVLNDMN
jgi:carboxyl-terminal processing protease